MDIANLLQTNFLSGPLGEAFKKSLIAADSDNNKIISEKEFNKAKEAFPETDAFKRLTKEQKDSFTNNLRANDLWAQQGAASVVNYDGNKLQAEYYRKATDQNGKPLATQAQLDHAKEKGFGDVDGDGEINGNELKVADINRDGNIDSKDGDLNKDGKVNKDDRGIDLGSSKSSPGFDKEKLKLFLELIQQLTQIWAPNQRR